MINAIDILECYKLNKFDFFTGVPCSFLTQIINHIASNEAISRSYIGATNEGESVAIAAGAWLAGKNTVVMCQNSGLGNAVNPLTSLNAVFKIPTMMLVTWRGYPGKLDEPQHQLMGKITPYMLSTMEIPYAIFPHDIETFKRSLTLNKNKIDESRLPFVYLLKDNIITTCEENIVTSESNENSAGKIYDFLERKKLSRRIEVLERMLSLIGNEVPIIVSTGKGGRELYTLSDREQHFYMVGSMGCASPLGLGVALNIDNYVLVLDGDGALLMKLGAMATIGAYKPKHLIHVLLDNGVHDSTGGQETVSKKIDFAAISIACGYRNTYKCDSLSGFEKALQNSINKIGPSFIHMSILPGSITNLGRPEITPQDVALRFKTFLRSRGNGVIL
ncbi:phosphonopyruvate decarboxylase [Pantoea agglomerans]|uniref:phosphonopyruvate decarboxylase n=1 Tax=Enterobacter agglomerans TaxID=549 RepID=UPI003C7BD7DE